MYDVKEELKNTIKISQVIERLGGLNLSRFGNNLQGNCPTGHSSQGGKCFSVNLDEDYFSCFNCKAGGDVITLVELVNNFTFPDALSWLTENFRPDLAKHLSSNIQPDPAKKEYYSKATLYNLVYQWGKELLYLPAGREALDYLVKNRGYDIEVLKNTDWIFYPSDEAIREYLSEKTPEAGEIIKSLPLNGYYGDNFRLALPYRDRRGSITGFMKRSLHSGGIDIKTYDGKEHTSVRWDSTSGMVKEDLFNLHNCKGQDTLLVVEGCPDAAYLTALGMKNIVAVGQGLLSKKHLEGLNSFKVKNIILSFDNDPINARNEVTGIENTMKALKTIKYENIKAFVLNPPDLSPCKDPDEFVRNRGLVEFNKLVEKPLPSSKWISGYYTGKYQLENPLEKEKFIQDLLDYANTLPVFKSREGEELLNEVSAITGSDIETLVSEYDYLKGLKKREEQLKSFNSLFNEGFKLLKEERLEELNLLLMERPREIELQGSKTINIFYTVDEFYSDIKRSQDGLETGFKELDRYIKLPPGAITVVMGKSGHGKTTFLMNLYLNLIKKYKDKTFIFFSYEEDKKDIFVKLVNIDAGKVLNQHENLNQIINYLKFKDVYKTIQPKPEIENSILRLKELINRNRLALVYEPMEVNELCSQIFNLTNDYDVGAVFIDYIQRIPVKNKYQSRQLELQAVSDRLLQTAIKVNIPIILGAQVNKEAKGIPKDKDVREAGDILQDANIVLSVYNPGKEEENIKPDINGNTPFKVAIAKSRNSQSNNTEIELLFHGPTLKISDGNKGGLW